MSDKIAVENVNQPGSTTRVDATKYNAMKSAILAAMPKGGAALTNKEMRAALDPHLSVEHFPGGATAGWWLKCVQLDLEAKGVLERQLSKPLRFVRVG